MGIDHPAGRGIAASENRRAWITSRQKPQEVCPVHQEAATVTRVMKPWAMTWFEDMSGLTTVEGCG